MALSLYGRHYLRALRVIGAGCCKSLLVAGALVPALALPVSAADAYPDMLTREYVTKLGILHVQIESMQLMKDTCRAEHPEFVSANESAYESWRLEHERFLQEIGGHWVAMMRKMAGGDAAKLARIAAGIETRMQPLKNAVVAKLKSGTPQELKIFCDGGYRAALKEDRANLERAFPELVRTIRAGYGDSFVRADASGASAEQSVDGFKLGEFPPAGKPAVLKLIDGGAGAKYELRCRFDKGYAQELVMLFRTSIGMQIDGQHMRANRMPAYLFSVNGRVVDADAREARYEFNMPQAPKLIETEGVDAKMLESMTKAMDKFPDFRVRATVTDRCLNKDVIFDGADSPDPRMKQMIQSFRDSMDRLWAQFPEEPVGAGARWKTLERIEKDGMTLYQVATMTLERVENGQFFVGTRIEQAGTGAELQAPGLPAGTKMELVRLKTNGNGDVVFSAGSLFPRGSVTLGTAMVLNSRADEILSQLIMDVHVYAQMTPGDGK